MGKQKHKNKKVIKKNPSNNNTKRSHDEEQEVLPYCIQQSPVFGRFLQAAKDLSAGEVILEEKPLAVGPSQDSQPICISCYTSLDYDRAARCSKCSFPLCSLACPGRGKPTGHSDEECSVFFKCNINKISSSSLKNQLDAIVPLRCLILRDSDALSWDVVNAMEAHTDKRKLVKNLWNTNQRKVVNVIRNEWNIQDFDEDLIHHICGVLEVNAFEVGKGLRGIYRTAYLFAHNCIPNTRHSDGEDFVVTFRTTVNVPRNATFFVTYTYILQGTSKRRRHLKDTKFFDCTCDRCCDVTEKGTNMSAMKCTKCADGLVIVTDPLKDDSDWICHQCSAGMSASSVELVTARIFKELDEIDGNDIPGFESFLMKHSKTLSENHYLILSALHCLFELYGKIKGYLIHDLTKVQLQRKVDICRILLHVFNKLDPGLSKQRGLILYEMHAPLMVQLQSCYRAKTAGKLELKQKHREILKCLEEAYKILQVEPLGSYELEISVAAKHALDNIVEWRTAINQM